MFTNGTPSSQAARQVLRSANSRRAKLYAGHSKPSTPGTSKQPDAGDAREAASPVLRTCEEAYLEYCGRTNLKAVATDGTICGPDREDLRLRDVLRPNRASLKCTRCGSNHTRHISFASKDDPNAWYTKCVECSNATEDEGDSIGPFSIYEGKPRFEQRTWFPYTDKEKALLNDAKRQSRSQTATPTRRPSGGSPASVTQGRKSAPRAGRSRALSPAPTSATPRTPATAISASRDAGVVSATSIEELREKPVNAMTDDEVFELVTYYLRREGLIATPSPSPAPSISSPSRSTSSQPPSLSSPTWSASTSPSRAPGKRLALNARAPFNVASTATPSSSRAPEAQPMRNATIRTDGASTRAQLSSSRAVGKQRALNVDARSDSPIARQPPASQTKRRKVMFMVELVNRSYYRNPVTVTNNRLTWEDVRALPTLHYIFIFPQYGLDVFDSRLQHWRQFGTTTTIPVLPQQTTLFARIVYSRALSLKDPIVIPSDSEDDHARGGPADTSNTGRVDARVRVAGSPDDVIVISSDSEPEQEQVLQPVQMGSGNSRKRAGTGMGTHGGRPASSKRRKV